MEVISCSFGRPVPNLNDQVGLGRRGPTVRRNGGYRIDRSRCIAVCQVDAHGCKLVQVEVDPLVIKQHGKSSRSEVKEKLTQIT